MIINIKMLLSVLLSTTGLFTYVEFIEDVDLVINNEVIYTASKSNMDKEYSDKIREYQNDLIEKSRNEVLNIESEYNEEILFSEIENVEFKKVTEYRYILEITHEIERIEEEKIPFEKEEKKDDSKFTDYKEVTTKGIEGSKKEIYTVKYINGIESEIYNQHQEITEPVKEIITVGTKEIPNISSNNTNSWGNGNSSNWGSPGGNAGGNNSGGNSSSGGSAPTGAYYGVDSCMAEANRLSLANPGVGYGCSDRDGDNYWDLYIR